jgi:hypothetical protein
VEGDEQLRPVLVRDGRALVARPPGGSSSRVRTTARPGSLRCSTPAAGAPGPARPPSPAGRRGPPPPFSTAAVPRIEHDHGGGGDPGAPRLPGRPPPLQVEHEPPGIAQLEGLLPVKAGPVWSCRRRSDTRCQPRSMGSSRVTLATSRRSGSSKSTSSPVGAAETCQATGARRGHHQACRGPLVSTVTRASTGGACGVCAGTDRRATSARTGTWILSPRTGADSVTTSVRGRPLSRALQGSQNRRVAPSRRARGSGATLTLRAVCSELIERTTP